MSSFNGLITEVPGIAVDNFEGLDKRAYFLSHCHRDHTQGLNNPHLKKYLVDNGVFIYTSELSAAIISATADFDNVKEQVKILQLGARTLVKLNATKHHQEMYMDVTAIPAGHCFGSVMLLFHTKSRTVLFTGDFRISANDVSKLGHLHSKELEPIVLDKIYLDTTFLSCDYDNFPKRSSSTEGALDEIRQWLELSPEHWIALHPSARFGYEYMFNEIYKRTGLKVYVGGDDWDLYRSYQHIVPGVTNNWKTTRVHKCRNRTEHFTHKCLPCDVTNKRFLFVHLSAMKWSNFYDEDPTFCRKSDKRIDVCFPTHCSRSELLHFVGYFSPKAVVGFPNEFSVESSAERPAEILFNAPKRRRLVGKAKAVGGR